MKSIVEIESTLREELEEIAPDRCPELLSRQERDRAIERSFLGLYRWYVDRSQTSRNWSADRSFDWRQFRQDHSEPMLRILEGFFAVEQYNPDYTSGIVNVLRGSYGRGAFQVRWGAEEQKHSDLWRNCLLFGRQRSPRWIEDYVDQLRSASKWEVPWDDPLRMLLYQVIQERATQLNYLHTAAIARGSHPTSPLVDDVDPVLAEAARVIAIDEAAHYNFFLEGSRLYFYYYPEETAEALLDVIRFFIMPGRNIVPDYVGFARALSAAGVFDVRQHYIRDTLQVVLENLGISNLTALSEGVKRCRLVPDTDERMRETTLFESLSFGKLEDSVKRTCQKVRVYEDEIGFSDLEPAEFIKNPAVPNG